MSDLPPMATPRVASGALVRSPAGHVLLVRPTYKDGWDIPGGYVEPGESPAAACRREVQEEIGVDLDLGRLLVVDWAPQPDEGDKILFVFDGGTMTESAASALVPDGVEISAIGFHAAADLPDRTRATLARRLVLAMAAARDGGSIYAEHGVSQPLP